MSAPVERRGEREHELKTLRQFYHYVESGEKNFELRKDDRGYRVGDVLRLREYVRGLYTGKELRRVVTYLLAGERWLQKGYVCMALAPDRRQPPAEGMTLRQLIEQVEFHGGVHKDDAPAFVAALRSLEGPSVTPHGICSRCGADITTKGLT